MATILTKIIAVGPVAEGSYLVRFELTNKGPENVFVLKRNTPLEGLKSDCLEVLFQGKRIPYDGYLFKRAEVQLTDYVRVNAGQTLSQEFDLSEAYNVSQPGHYEVRFDESCLVTILEDEITADVKRIASSTSVVLEQQSVSILSEKGSNILPPIGVRMREEAKKKEIDRSPADVMEAKKPILKGGSEERKKQVQKAHDSGYIFAGKAAVEVADNAGYTTWFGVYTSARSSLVKGNYEKIIKRMEDTTFTYELDGSGCGEDTFAYTTKGGSTVWLCTLFWKAPDEGFDSKAGTIVHEHSHATCNTDDLVYSQQKCKELAKNSPDKAVKNADNYEYYSESLVTVLA